MRNRARKAFNVVCAGLFFGMFLAGCGGTGSAHGGFCFACSEYILGTDNGGVGYIYLDTNGGSKHKMLNLASANCVTRGYYIARVSDHPYRSYANGVQHYSFQCITAEDYAYSAAKNLESKTSESSKVKQLDGQNKAPTLDAAKRKCIELGFKSGTEGFGKCVLKLSN